MTRSPGKLRGFDRHAGARGIFFDLHEPGPARRDARIDAGQIRPVLMCPAVGREARELFRTPAGQRYVLHFVIELENAGTPRR